MNKKERVLKIMETLDKLYPKTPIPLKHKQNNVFTFLVAVLLSARATDVSVNKATKGLYKVANTPQKIFNLGESGLKKYIKSI